MATLNNVTTSNEYTEKNTLKCPGSEVQNLIITGGAVYIQVKERETGFTAGAPAFGAEMFLPPGYYGWAREIEELRVKSGVPGVPSQVTVNTVP
jgi:hypothetical protein